MSSSSFSSAGVYAGRRPSRPAGTVSAVLWAAALIFFAGCNRQVTHGVAAYVGTPQVTVRDRVAAVYNKVAVLKNGDRVEVLEHKKIFSRVRTSEGQEGWVEQRALVGAQVFDAFNALQRSNATAPVQAKGMARAELNMHVAPGRQTEALYQLKRNDPVEILQRSFAGRPQPKASPYSNPTNSAGSRSAKAEPMLEDWWLVRDGKGHVGWVYGRLLDLDVPLEIAQYAENKRVVAYFVLNEVRDDRGQSLPQYLVLLTEQKEGQPFDFNQARIFTRNSKRHHYETAYRNRKLFGMLPARVGKHVFDKREGEVPTFTLSLKQADGRIVPHTYKLTGVIVREVGPSARSSAGKTSGKTPGKTRTSRG